jgi:diguanylate cyclase (GGDEF)-like protein
VVTPLPVLAPLLRRARRRAAGGVAAVAAAALLAGAPAQAAPALLQQVYDIEAAHGNDPHEVIRELAPLQAAARAAGGDGLRAFLAAWGYAHGAIDNPAVADAAVEELTELGDRTHDAGALASAYTLKASLLEFQGRMRAAYGWIAGAVELAERNGSPDLMYWVDATAGGLAVANGQIAEGIRCHEKAAAAARASRNPRREAQSYQALVPLRVVQGQLDAALREAALVRSLAARSTEPGLAVSGWMLESFAAEAAGDPARAAHARAMATQLQRELAARGPAPAASVNSQAGGPSWQDDALDEMLVFSGLHLSARDYGRAQGFARRALAEAGARGDADAAAHARIDLGLADVGLGRTALGEQEAGAGLAALERHARDAELLIQLNRYCELLERVGDAGESRRRLREALLLESELARRDRRDTVVALQRQSSFEQHRRHMEQLEHENALQSAEIARRNNERALMGLLALAMAVGGGAAGRLWLRARRSNRQLAVNNAELAFASLHDKVTGLHNRRAMEADTEALELAGGRRFCLVTISVKQFGLIVGSLGHQLGDTLLCQIAARLEAEVTRFDGRLYRVDGVTFGALFEFGGDPPRLHAILEALAAAMEPPLGIGNQDVIVAIGAGASEYPKDAGTAQEVARLAELAKLEAYADPGSGFRVYDSRIGESQRDKLRMESRMLKALEAGHFELYYQGQRGLPDGRICGFEALLRWRDGDAMVSPAQFIPLAEETGLIVRIGAWVLEQACRQAKAWADSGAGRPLVAVNISPRQFNHPDFLGMVRDTLARTGVDPRQIELEITEGSVMNDAEASIAQLHALRALGLHLAIDDFGTGYASLSYLRRFPLDRLKIDRAFIRQLNASEQDDTIVRTVIELAHALGLSVTAEGVETIEQERRLQHWGCDVIQGFLRFRPAPAGAATALLREDTAAADRAALPA